MTFRDWTRYFERNRRRRLPELARGSGAGPVPEAWRPLLAASLARFQLGEAGEGRIAREIQACSLPGVGADYRASVRLFVREEARHALILAHAVRALGGGLLQSHWTERAFRGARRLLGLRTKLLVLLAAEVVGEVFYRSVAGRLPAGPLRDALQEIVADEVAHRGFHAEFFRWQTRTAPARALFRAAFRVAAPAAFAVAWWDHRATLRCVGVSGRAFAASARAAIAGVERAVAGGRAVTGRHAGSARGGAPAQSRAAAGARVIATDL